MFGVGMLHCCMVRAGGDRGRGGKESEGWGREGENCEEGG